MSSIIVLKGIEASRPSLGTRRSLKSMDLTGRGSDDSTPSLLHRFKVLVCNSTAFFKHSCL